MRNLQGMGNAGHDRTARNLQGMDNAGHDRTVRKYIVLGVTTILIAGLGLSPAAIAAAPSQLEDHAISVSYADLDIKNAAGAKVLYVRLQRASRSVCGLNEVRSVGSLNQLTHAKQCYRAALDKAVAKIDSKALEELHDS